MTALILDGKTLASNSEAELTKRVAKLKANNNGQAPILATILVGGDPASATYVKMKQNACKRIGMESIAVELDEKTTTNQLLAKIEELNNNPNCHGILLQHPTPSQINERACFDFIDAAKDVDGVTCLGFGRMAMGEPAYGSATPQGIMRILQGYNIDLSGKHAVVVGRRASEREETEARARAGRPGEGGEMHRSSILYLPKSAGQLVETPRGGRRPVRRRRTLGRMRGSRVGTDTGNGGRAPVPLR